jgi:hypothetical protein
MTSPATFAFVGTAAKTGDLKRRVVEIAREEFRGETVMDFGDPLAGWDPIKIGDELERDMDPNELLCHRGGLLLRSLRRNAAQKIRTGVTLGFFDRLGFDTWFGANIHRLDMRTLGLWEAIIEHGIRGLGLSPPACYYHTDGDDRTKNLLRQYCTRLPGQHFEVISPQLEIEAQAWCVIGSMHRVLTDRRMAA